MRCPVCKRPPNDITLSPGQVEALKLIAETPPITHIEKAMQKCASEVLAKWSKP